MKKSEFSRNPFTPSFGSVPRSLAGRTEIINDMIEGLEGGPGNPNRATILTGARGSGKTVLLTSIAEMAEERGWISVNVTSGQNMLAEIIVQLRSKASELLTPDTRERLTGLQIGGFGITLQPKKEEKTTWRSEMTNALHEMNAKQVGLLITVDEISRRHEELAILVDTFQHFVRERRETMLLLAGLPNQVSMLLQDEQISFLRRAFQHNLEAIDVTDIAYTIKETVESGGRTISEDVLFAAAEQTGGFAFMIQLLGYHMWKQHPDCASITMEDVEHGLKYATRDMERMVFDAMMIELSEREQEFLRAMAKDEAASAMSEIAERVGIRQNNASQLRSKLIARGVIKSAGHGKVVFAMPLLREYLRKR